MNGQRASPSTMDNIIAGAATHTIANKFEFLHHHACKSTQTGNVKDSPIVFMLNPLLIDLVFL